MWIFTDLKEDYMSSRHKLMFCGSEQSATKLASFYYVPLTNECAEEIGSVRMEPHTDLGTVTVLLQDDMNGLEVNFI